MSGAAVGSVPPVWSKLIHGIIFYRSSHVKCSLTAVIAFLKRKHPNIVVLLQHYRNSAGSEEQWQDTLSRESLQLPVLHQSLY